MAINDFKEFILSNQDKKNPLYITTSMVQYPTGYMYLDYGTGSYVTVCNEDDDPLFQYHNIGITSGSVNVLVAKSQGGKTSLAMAEGVAIIEPYITQALYYASIRDTLSYANDKKIPKEITDAPFIQILDTEKTLPIDYAKKISRYTNKLTERHIVINQITTDRDLMVALDKHVKFKVEYMQKCVQPMLDMFGHPIIDYPPTVLIIDSMSQLLLEDCDDPSTAKKGKGDILDIYATATQNTAGARRAKIITALYSQLVNYAKRYNVCIFSINHINKLLPGPNGVPTKQYRGLRPGETIGGGERAIYLASTILRLDFIKQVNSVSASAVNLGEDITGHISIAKWIKSKSNSKENSCQLVYTNKAGYDPLLSNLWYGKETGDLTRVGNSFCLEAYPQYKFNLRNYAEVFGDHPEMFTAYYDELRRKCAKLLDNPEEARKADKKLLNDIREDLRSDFGHSDAMDMDDMFMEAFNA